MSSIATADVPLQSVEDQDGFALDPDAPAQLDGNTPRAAPGVSFRSLKTESSDEHAILTPQVSVSPAASPEPPDGHPGIDSLMNNMHLSPSRPSARGQSHRHASVSGFGMHEVTQALDAVARQPDITRAQSVPVAGRGSKPPDAPHDVADEDPPDGLVHSHEFQRALTRAQMAMGNIERALSGSELDGDSQSTVYQLRSQASNLSRFQYPASRTVGFVGDSGVGKSSLLNSLLDKKDLARTGGSGAACTCVVTEYLYHPEETMDVVVDVFPSDELRQQIQYMVSQYRRFHRNEYETDEGPNAEIEAEFALLTLSSMFRSTLDDPSYLLDDDLDAILDQMVLWAEDNLEDEDLFATRRGLTTDECSSRIMQLSSEPPADSRPAAWPYIKKLRVFLDAHILSTGLVLADLPGLRDLNPLRQRTTERHVLHCHEILAVCSILRATTDEGVRDIFELARRTQLSNVGIVCTKSEGVRAKEAANAAGGVHQATIGDFQDAIAEVDKELTELNKKLKRLEDDEQSDDEEVDYRGLWRRLRHLNHAKKQREFELDKCLVIHRNATVARQLEERHRSGVPGQTVRVMCVSNEMYEKNRDEPKTFALPRLELSGIIEARRHCMSIVTSAQRRAARRYINDQIPEFLSRLDLWVQSGARSGTVESRLAAIQALDEVEDMLRRNIDSTSGNSIIRHAAQNAKDGFANTVLEAEDVNQWSQSAERATRDWAGWHPSTYAAFCRNYGDHWTKGAGYRHWNEEAMKQMVDDMTPAWEALCSNTRSRKIGQIAALRREMATATLQLGTLCESNPYMPRAVVNTLDALQRILSDSMLRAHEKLEDKLGNLKADALSGHRSSMIGVALEPTYTRCRTDHGDGVDQRRKTAIKRAFGDPWLFRNIIREACDTFKEDAVKMEADMAAAGSECLRAIQSTFDLVRTENALRESEQVPQMRDLVEEVAQDAWDTIEESARVVNGE